MSKIVLISTFYLGTASANAICAGYLVEEFRRLGHDVDVICYEGEEDHGEHIYTVKKPQPQKFSVLRRLLNRVWLGGKLLFGIGEPVSNRTLTDSYYKRLCELHSCNDIDAIIAMYFPIECVKAVCRFKGENEKVKAIVYELDSVADGVANSPIQKFENRIYEKWLTKVYRLIDSIFVMKSHEVYWNKTFGIPFGEKMQIADIPVLFEKPILECRETTSVSMIYAGLIERRYRSPSYLLSVLRELNKAIDFKFTFYSKGDCEQEIAETATEVKAISQKGYVPQEELEQEILKTNFLISIGNSISRSVPSKIITYLSYGKPIIHFSSQKEDVCKEYFDNYPLALVIDQSMPIKEACKRICDFVQETKGDILSFELVKKMFYMNEPAYSAGLINNLIRREEHCENDHG